MFRLLALSRSICRTRLLTLTHPTPPPKLWPLRPISTEFPQQADLRPSPKSPTQPTRSIYVGNLPYAADEMDIRHAFSQLGKIVAIRVANDAEGRSKGFAHIDFESLDDTYNVIECARQQPITLLGRFVIVDYAATRRDNTREPNNKLYIYQYGGTEGELRKAFGAHANDIVNIYLLRSRRTTDNLRAGFIDFINVESARDALRSMHDTETEEGSHIKLMFARKAEDGPRNRMSRRVSYVGNLHPKHVARGSAYANEFRVGGGYPNESVAAGSGYPNEPSTGESGPGSEPGTVGSGYADESVGGGTGYPNESVGGESGYANASVADGTGYPNESVPGGTGYPDEPVAPSTGEQSTEPGNEPNPNTPWSGTTER